MLVVINTRHIKEEHVCWFTRRTGLGNIQIIQIVNRTYPHPDAPDNAVIVVTETVGIEYAPIASERAATWVLLEACQKAVTTVNEGGSQ